MKFIIENRASITYELIKLDTQINGDHVELLATIVHKDKGYMLWGEHWLEILISLYHDKCLLF